MPGPTTATITTGELVLVCAPDRAVGSGPRLTECHTVRDAGRRLGHLTDGDHHRPHSNNQDRLVAGDLRLWVS